MASCFPILTFHSVDERPSVISFAPRLFQLCLARLKESGYRTLGLPEVVDCLQQRIPFPARCFAITFDDGYRSVYDEAFPVLQRYGFSGTVFLTVGKNSNGIQPQRLPAMSDRSMLSWREIKEMHRSGIAFGGHTLTHPDLSLLDNGRIEAEVVGGKAVIEDALGSPVTSFAYPFGCYDARCREIVKQHFTCACSDRLGLVRRTSDPYAMERVDTYYLRHEKLLATIQTVLFPLYIRARSVPRQLRRAMGL
jgi:peptidoglycan/xylan/chitin deacetylase (PgdA/CDA1 family)